MTEMVDGSTPGTGIFGPSVDAFDQRVDELLEIVRSSKTAGRVFLAASRLGDFSVVWHLIAAARATTSRKRASQGFALAALLGAESLIVKAPELPVIRESIGGDVMDRIHGSHCSRGIPFRNVGRVFSDHVIVPCLWHGMVMASAS
jgi:hypothetical protein